MLTIPRKCSKPAFMKITQKYCVYAHSCDGEILYVGSGKHSRAFNFDPASRTKKWFAAISGRPVVVTILSEHADRAEAYEREFDHIHGLQPVGNTRGKTQRLSRNGLAVGRPRKKGKRSGAYIYTPTLDVRCASLREAARLINAPLSSVSRALYNGTPVRTGHGDIYFELSWD